MIKSDFYILGQKAQAELSKSTEWFINSFDHKYGSEDWQICRLKHQKYFKEGILLLEKANTYLHG